MKNTKTNKTIEKIHDRVKNFVEESDYINYLKFIKKFRTRSFFNQMLIYMTKENATFVMGYKQWIDKFNRIPVACLVCRSLSNKNCECEERTPPIRIVQLAPITYIKENAKGEEEEKIWFKDVYVYDIEDTEPLPDLPIKEVFNEFDWNIKTVDVDVNFKELETMLLKIIKDNKFKFRYEEIFNESLGGWTDHKVKEIVCKENTTEADKIHTILHEIGHMFAHSEEELDRKRVYRPLVETEAETIAYVVADYLNIDTSSYSIGYIANWSKGNEDILQESVKRISKFANVIMDKIEEQGGI
tara:strand:+ start:41 stop:940 length:900 start_codon:yes stop_codon:yes gene_type:complete